MNIGVSLLRHRIKKCVETTYFRVGGSYLHKVFRDYEIFFKLKNFFFFLNGSFHDIGVSATIIHSGLQTACQTCPL